MLKIRIFISSSEGELEDERCELIRFIEALNNRYVDRGVFIEFGPDEDIHDENMDYIENSADTTVFMFFTKAGPRSVEELDAARRWFLEHHRPDVFVFFRAVGSMPASTGEIAECIDKVERDYGHYYKLFDSADTIKLELLEYLVDSLDDGSEIAIRDGKVLIDEVPLSSEIIEEKNIFSYQNNPDITKLRERKDALLGEMIAASEAGDAQEALRISAELEEVRNTYNALETDILGMLRQFYLENRKGIRSDPRRLEALRLLERGKVVEAKALIPEEEITMRASSLETRMEVERLKLSAEAEEIVEDGLIRIRALQQDVSDPERNDSIDTVYDTIYECALTAERYDVIMDDIAFNNSRKNYPKAIRKAARLRYIYDDPERSVPEGDRADLMSMLGNLYYSAKDNPAAEQSAREAITIYERILAVPSARIEYGRAVTQNILANVLKNTDRFGEAEEMYREARETLRRLYRDTGSEIYRRKETVVSNNLASLYKKTNRPKEAGALFEEVLGIRQSTYELTGSEEDYEELALSCNNLASLYKEQKRLDKAEELFSRALSIRRALSTTALKRSNEPKLALSCNNLASVYKALKRYDEAKKLLIEALEIRKLLCDTVSRETYEPDYVTSLNNLASLYKELKRYDEAERLFSEAHSVRKRHAEDGGKGKVISEYALSCNNLASVKKALGKYDEAEKLFTEALDIRRHQAETVSREAYSDRVALSLSNLASLLKAMKRYDEAEKLYREALEIRKDLADTVSFEKYASGVAKTCRDLSSLLKEAGRADETVELSGISERYGSFSAE